jgi:hypothetical protein
MAVEFEFLSPTDKPALLGLSTLEWQARVMATLHGMGFKVHTADNHEDFQARFAQVQYQVVVMEELFASTTPTENLSLMFVQNLTMSLRRHATIFLLGDSFNTLDPMQAFAQSVHAVVNSTELASLDQIIQKVSADNDLFLNAYRDTQFRIAQGKLGT